MIGENEERTTLRRALEEMELVGPGDPLPEPYRKTSGVAGRSMVWFLILPSVTGGELSIVAKFDEPERAQKEWSVIETLRRLNTPLTAILPMPKSREDHGVVIYQNLAAQTLSGRITTLGDYLAKQLET